MRFLLCAGLLAAGPGGAQTIPPMPASALPTPAPASSLRTYALRLRPGQDVRQELLAFVEHHNLKAACVLTAVGSLTTATLRLANQEGATVYQGHFEIVSLVGTLARSGSHLHLSVSDSTGRTVGGHLLEGNRVYTTLELVIGELPELEFRRETDPTFGYRELTVYPAAAPARGPAPRRAGRKK
ncbi:DNA-binding protein [Hymenobacter sp. NST-14]|uniref:PPC domain-containing DNA-binding protein n=1 Tax=Hymenobacter piscis TaxID=2839984 RepID=UPI001C035C7B|nr:PPC domain-containing DNA-binding protein [Hymenobacter piscis]MBT9391939.1 DNA-binding protein [Hymenobacter piscis]